MLERLQSIPPQYRALAAAFIIGGFAVLAVTRGLPVETVTTIAAAIFGAGGLIDAKVTE